jgi:uncharacterized membrane protein YjjP (DUF1212 family)
MFKNKFEKWLTILVVLFGFLSGLIVPNLGVVDNILIAFFYAFIFFVIAKLINTIISMIKKKMQSN